MNKFLERNDFMKLKEFLLIEVIDLSYGGNADFLMGPLPRERDGVAVAAMRDRLGSIEASGFVVRVSDRIEGTYVTVGYDRYLRR